MNEVSLLRYIYIYIYICIIFLSSAGTYYPIFYKQQLFHKSSQNKVIINLNQTDMNNDDDDAVL
jgi:hypothetical protein